MKQQMPDACPKCLTVGYPHTWHDDRGSILALYICQRCRWHWRCWFNPDCLEVRTNDRGSIAKVQSIPHRTGNRKSAQA
jgi:hypothetical protein